MLDASDALVPVGAVHFPVCELKQTRSFAFLLLRDFTLLAFSSAIEPFRIANQLSQKPLYRWTVVSEDGRPARSSSGVEVAAVRDLRSVERDTTLLVCAGNLMTGHPAKPTLAFLHHHYRTGGSVGGICAGAVALARAGLLGRHAFTLHWECHPGFFELFPRLEPTKRRFEIDGRVMTCGGGAAAADMAISIIRQDYGDDFAAIVADMCLLRDDAGANLSQRSSIGTALHTRNPALIEIVKIMIDNIEYPLTMAELAQRVGYTARHIERQFQRCIGQTPMGYYLGLRLDHARSLIAETDMTLFEVAAATGFNTKSHFSKVFLRRFGSPPSKVHHHRRGTRSVY
ncbi:transcriptional regulator GlxA family with amidase domain [Defluviimonas denitrificans]|jgi:transcriptional regulator GlxA family with amidase domain|uniref:Transcriptional regulator GlxA family with amidase domain n=1 Tax=Albidovulum denitrificans TaxID=404881 RepID=A0A2S8SAS5_9RHOB|nr:GlxA family transcriptional regulator [Defluviimonas denitrificans]PQV57904.1 transcriptional regulator GlxA family with amidase domain [Defluviimonas denitrificans]